MRVLRRAGLQLGQHEQGSGGGRRRRPSRRRWPRRRAPARWGSGPGPGPVDRWSAPVVKRASAWTTSRLPASVTRAVTDSRSTAVNVPASLSTGGGARSRSAEEHRSGAVPVSVPEGSGSDGGARRGRRRQGAAKCAWEPPGPCHCKRRSTSRVGVRGRQLPIAARRRPMDGNRSSGRSAIPWSRASTIAGDGPGSSTGFRAPERICWPRTSARSPIADRGQR